jgi:hypothetical protein
MKIVKGFSPWEGKIARDVDSPLEEDGFEPSVPLTGYSGIFRKKMRRQRSSQKPSRPASKTSAIRVILRPVLTASSGSARAR